MTADALLSRLQGVKQTGHGQWRARCPAHNSRSLSLSMRETDDSRLLLHCFVGCSADEVVSAVGLTLADLMPPQAIGHHLPRERRPFNAADVLACLETESLIVAIAASDVAKGKNLSESDSARIWLAASRISAARDVVNGR